ncbi:MAG TPA: FN3 associated domain-containing protein [Puia sp.]|nr:FN3 associated domain-containing protein [Puia sp.]
MPHRYIVPLIVLLLTAGISAGAQSIHIFSRYNYYMPGDSASIIAVMENDVPEPGCALILYHKGKQIGTGSKGFHKAFPAPFDLDSLPLGTDTLTWDLMRHSRIDTSGTVIVVKRAPKPNAVQIDEWTGGLIADRMPFFPFGFYCTPVGDLPEREVVHGFNAIGPYQSNLPATRAERKAYMDRCAQLGIRVQYAVNSLIGSGHNGARGLDMSDADKLALLKEEVLAFRDHPALLSWYINDEPDGQGRPPAILEAAYQTIHALDPYHPISIVFMMPSRAADFRHTMDIAMTDPYPIPGPADKVMNDLAAYTQAYRYEKSVWLVPQAFGGQEMWAREPTAQEIRLMTYMGLISGVKGIQYYVHAVGNINPQSVSAWSACSDLAVETSQMTAFLLSPETAPAVHCDDPKVLTKTFWYKNHMLVLVANNENRPKSLDLSFGEGWGSFTAACWFENRHVPVENGRLHDMIDAYGTRVYLIGDTTRADTTLVQPGNMTLNPGFETIVSPGLPIGSNTTHTSRAKADPGATFFADPREHVEGLFSLRLITPVDSGGDRIRLVPFVVDKGNSYTVSIWARAKKQDKMPVFRLALDALGETHSYTLTDRWAKYAFTFTAPQSSTNAILSFDVITPGTAWFDLVQVSPDPVIHYHLDSGRVATVAITSAIDGAKLRYALDKTPDASSPVYRGPFVLKKAATVYAGVFTSRARVAASETFVPVNLALGKPVELAIPYDPHYPAAGNGTLTDGVMGTTGFKDGKWLGFNGADLNVTIDLQLSMYVREVTASFLCDPNSGIFLPPSVAVYTSTDGRHFDPVTEKPNDAGNVRGEPYLHKVRLSVGRSARYVRVVAKAFGPIPDGYLFKGSMSWLFTDEVLVQ